LCAEKQNSSFRREIAVFLELSVCKDNTKTVVFSAILLHIVFAFVTQNMKKKLDQESGRAVTAIVIATLGKRKID